MSNGTPRMLGVLVAPHGDPLPWLAWSSEEQYLYDDAMHGASMRAATTGGGLTGKPSEPLHPVTSSSLNREQVLALLRAHKATLAQRFGVTELAVFGSFARDQAADESDVDILVSFRGKADWQRYFGAQFYLEDLLGRPVDLVTDKALRTELRPYVEGEAVHV